MNAALVAVAQAVAAGKGVSVPLHREAGFVVLTPDSGNVKYTKAQAAELLADCMNQARTASLAYAKDLPADPKAALAIVYTLSSGKNKGLKVGAWAHALVSTVGGWTDAGKSITAARNEAKIADNGGYTCEGVEGVFHSRKEARKQGLRAEYGMDWWKMDNADDLRKEWSKKVSPAGEQETAPVKVEAVAQTGAVTKATLQERCEALSLPVSGTKAELQARIDAVPLAGQMGWHS